MMSVAGLARRLRSAFYLALAPPFSVPDIRVGRTGNLWRLQHRVTTNLKGFYSLVYMNFLRFYDKRRRFARIRAAALVARNRRGGLRMLGVPRVFCCH